MDKNSLATIQTQHIVALLIDPTSSRQFVGEHRGRITGHHGHHERGTVLRRITSYRDHHLNLIDLELEHEMEDLTDRLKNWPKQRLSLIHISEPTRPY